MTSHQKNRFIYIILCGMGVLGIILFVLSALQENLMYFVTPTDLLTHNHNASPSKIVRLGGVVEKGSIQKDPKTLTIHFIITDFKNKISVSYRGIPPDLFREGQGVIAEGNIKSSSSEFSAPHFLATKILAKHDETYKPPILVKKMDESF